MEALADQRLFERKRNRQSVELTEAGRHFVAEARSAILHIERTLMNAKAVARGANEILNIGKSAFTDPYLVTTLLSIQLPLYRELKVKLWSNYSHELAHMVATGELDLALITATPDTPQLSSLTVAESPIYIVVSKNDILAHNKELHLEDLRAYDWILLASYVNPHVHEMIQKIASERGITASDKHYVMTAEEASEMVQAHKGVAFLPGDAAWRIACDEITIRPLMEERLLLVTKLATRSDNNTRLVSEFVRTASRKLSKTSPPQQGHQSLGRVNTKPVIIGVNGDCGRAVRKDQGQPTDSAWKCETTEPSSAQRNPNEIGRSTYAPMPAIAANPHGTRRRHAITNRTSGSANKRLTRNADTPVTRRAGGLWNGPILGSTASVNSWSVSRKPRPATRHLYRWPPL